MSWPNELDRGEPCRNRSSRSGCCTATTSAWPRVAVAARALRDDPLFVYLHGDDPLRADGGRVRRVPRAGPIARRWSRSARACCARRGQRVDIRPAPTVWGALVGGDVIGTAAAARAGRVLRRHAARRRPHRADRTGGRAGVTRPTRPRDVRAVREPLDRAALARRAGRAWSRDSRVVVSAPR